MTTSSTKVLTRTQVSPGKIFSAALFQNRLEHRSSRGRDFDDRDTSTSAKVAIVNQAFARKILKVADPLGKRFRIHEAPGKPRPLYEIVGVTADNKFQDMHEEFLPFMYFPSTQEEKPSPDDHILIRSSLPLTNLISSMKETIADVNPGIDLEFLVFQTRIQNSLIQDELMATLSSFFGFLAALLAAIGSTALCPTW